MIYNLTQHSPTPAQIEAGVGQPFPWAAGLLTIESVGDDVMARAIGLTIALVKEHGLLPAAPSKYGENLPRNDAPKVMIGGAPRLMAPLESCLVAAGFAPVYSFSTRNCIETPQSDGSVRKEYVFSHAGFDHAWTKFDGGNEEANGHTPSTRLRANIASSLGAPSEAFNNEGGNGLFVLPLEVPA